MHMSVKQDGKRWYYARGNEVLGPVHEEQLSSMAAQGELQPHDYLWREGMVDWIAGSEVPEIFEPPRTPPTPPVPQLPLPQRADALARKIAAGVCGILLGAFGVHKFILGYTSTGLAMLLITLCTFFLAYPIMHVIGIIEGVIYLVKDEDEFYRDYIVRSRRWF